MPEDVFISIASEHAGRSKETVGKITKTVNYIQGELVYMTKDREVCTVKAVYSAKEKIESVFNRYTPENCYPVFIDNQAEKLLLWR